MPTRAEINAYNKEKGEIMAGLVEEGADRATKDAAMQDLITRRELVTKYKGGSESQWGGTVLANKDPSDNTPILPWDPEGSEQPPVPIEGWEAGESLIEEERPPLLEPPQAQPPNRTTAFNDAFTDMLITRDTGSFRENLEARRQSRNVQNEMVDLLIEEFRDSDFKSKSLARLSELPREEQLRVIEWHASNLDWSRLTGREALLIHVMRAGYTDMSMQEFDKLTTQFNATELDQFRLQIRDQQVSRLRKVVDDFVAKRDWDNPFLQVAQQDFAPFMNALTRIGYGWEALEAADVELGGIRSLLPGEVRQKLRVTFANMSVDERVQMIREVGEALESMREGKYGPLFTEYGIMETFIETFNDELLEKNIPKNTLDRWIVAKVGGRGVRAAFRATNAIQARNVARVAGNQKLRAKLDRELGIIMREAGEDSVEASWTHMPRPPSLADDIDVLPDSLKDQVVLGDSLRIQILDKSDDITGIALTTDDKVKAVRRTIESELQHDGMVMHPQMGVLEAMPNDTGFKYTAVYGKTDTGGWDDLAEALDEALVLDPVLEHLKVMRRGPDGTLVEVGSVEDMRKTVGIEADDLNLQSLTDDELLLMSRLMERDSDEFKAIEEEAMRRARGESKYTGDALTDHDGEEYFLQMTHERFWSIIDKNSMDSANWRHTGRLSQWILNPSFQFGDEIFTSFDRAYRIEQGTLSKFEKIYEPYYQLSKSDKKVVSKVQEWVESEAKRTGVVPDLHRIQLEFDGLTTWLYSRA